MVKGNTAYGEPCHGKGTDPRTEEDPLICGGDGCSSRSFFIWFPEMQYEVIAKCTQCGYTATVYSG